MFHDGHELNGVVALFLDAWQDAVLEISVRGYFLFWRAYPDVALVYLQVLWTLWPFTFELKSLEGKGHLACRSS